MLLILNDLIEFNSEFIVFLLSLLFETRQCRFIRLSLLAFSFCWSEGFSVFFLLENKIDKDHGIQWD